MRLCVPQSQSGITRLFVDGERTNRRGGIWRSHRERFGLGPTPPKRSVVCIGSASSSDLAVEKTSNSNCIHKEGLTDQDYRPQNPLVFAMV